MNNGKRDKSLSPREEYEQIYRFQGSWVSFNFSEEMDWKGGLESDFGG